MKEKAREIIKEKLEEEIDGLEYLKYRKSKGWRNYLPIPWIPMNPKDFPELIENQEKEIAEIKALLK